MGLHKENNAVLQIHFLPGQVSTCLGRGLPAASLTFTSSGRDSMVGAWRWPWTPSLCPSRGSQATLRTTEGLLSWGSLKKLAQAGLPGELKALNDVALFS